MNDINDNGRGATYNSPGSISNSPVDRRTRRFGKTARKLQFDDVKIATPPASDVNRELSHSWSMPSHGSPFLLFAKHTQDADGNSQQLSNRLTKSQVAQRSAEVEQQYEEIIPVTSQMYRLTEISTRIGIALQETQHKARAYGVEESITSPTSAPRSVLSPQGIQQPH